MLALLEHIIEQRLGRQVPHLPFDHVRLELRFEEQTDKGRPFRTGAGLEPSPSDEVILIRLDQKIPHGFGGDRFPRPSVQNRRQIAQLLGGLARLKNPRKPAFS